MGNSSSNNNETIEQLKVSKRISIGEESSSSASSQNKYDDDLEGHGHREQVGLAEAPCDCDICNLFEEIYFTGEGECFALFQ